VTEIPGSRPPVPLPAARQPSLTTKRGHIKAVYLTDEQIRTIIENMRAGMSYQDACHDVGTSHLQFMRRIKRHPELHAEVNEIKRERRERRQEASLESGHGRNDDPGVHKSQRADR
jgi:hypothetical protein